MASNCHERRQNCVEKSEPLCALDELKEQQKTSKSGVSLFLKVSFYERAKTYLVAKEKQLQDGIEVTRTMTKWEIQTIKRKQWTVNSNNQILTCDNKVVLSKSQLYQNLLLANKSGTQRPPKDRPLAETKLC